MAPIRDKYTIHSKAVVCQDVELKGDITIGSGRSIVHPKATIFAIAGPIVIGSGCIIEEGAIIVNRRKEVMRIGDDNLFEIGCRVESPTVGDFNTISTRARVHHTVRIGSYCVIGAGCLVVPTEDEFLDDYTVIYGPAAERRTWSGRGKVQEADLREKARRVSPRDASKIQPATAWRRVLASVSSIVSNVINGFRTADTIYMVSTKLA
ncbi:Trimeric LpxA-like protein [Mycena sanguinolenta]|uniref:Dynactin subunit 6 n=1 Tax=Mycena sanguinolenta TaxID=230812 RepID=A0A8H7DI65_9AGAR|nr:Trimeric LpxA-like protein [Mycena sanguinolenta]